MKIGAVIRDQRIRHGWSYMDLAKASGLSKGYLWTLEQGETSPSLDVIEKLAKAFSTTVGWLIWLVEHYQEPSGLIYQPKPDTLAVPEGLDQVDAVELICEYIIDSALYNASRFPESESDL